MHVSSCFRFDDGIALLSGLSHSQEIFFQPSKARAQYVWRKHLGHRTFCLQALWPLLARLCGTVAILVG